MSNLYKEKINLSVGFFSVILIFGVAFWYIQHNFIFHELSLPLAGCLVLFIAFKKKGFDSLFQPPRKKFWRTVFLSFLISMMYSFSVLFFMDSIGATSSTNQIAEPVSNENYIYIFKNLITLGVQIVGEEMLTIIPLILLINAFLRIGLSNFRTKFFATLITSMLFGALHLSTYNWNFVQCFLLIGIGRIPDTLATMKQDTLWAGITSHILFDWTVIFISIAGQMI